ncbi:MAG: hypothetical protein A3I24_01130 [Candidatus Harrisonbacteria bacterium RIFCSPLOWO2_02_FULL_41_13b]|uniref:Type 4 fimbrial biogenesis protein PilO n=1 Tax=Candidatus Harrisonbacteria bacterium RIFCSPLOWO2_02_FULL_41_13b TaxID=1798409 RepID=A0A1G1ZRC2_9BACT|nr:MAG: hypothetical protein A3J53_03060 [Candidatus Harrisonbacteria bacterium RIFCSPHIGHO2_02_FULL_40_20]OGY67263.1 MAG: hypothetical protein A3I24_01130 [Candidatus Harrisonbacteria bacterium RIFCSPLOWO2_02_FULL_41_13b]
MNTDYFKKKILVNAIITLAIIIVLAIGLFFAGRGINQKVIKIESLRKELNTRLTALNSLTNLRQQSEKAKSLFGSLQTLLPTKDELINFPKELNGFAKANKVEIGFSFGSETAPAENQPGFTAFNLTLSGSYDNLVKFLKAIEGSQFFVGINSLDVTKDPQSQKFSALISGKIFSQ